MFRYFLVFTFFKSALEDSMSTHWGVAVSRFSLLVINNAGELYLEKVNPKSLLRLTLLRPPTSVIHQ